MSDVNFTETMSGLLSGMEGFISTKTVVGDAINLPDGTVILPLVDVSFGVGAGAFNKEVKNRVAGGMGGKMAASAVLVIKDGQTRLITVKDQDTVARICEMAPDLINRLMKVFKKGDNAAGGLDDEQVDEICEDILKED